MAGNIYYKDRAVITLSSSQGTVANGSAAAVGIDLDARGSVANNAQGDFQAQFLLLCQWSSVSGITALNTIAEIYAVPKIDGTNLPDYDNTAGAAVLPYQCLFGTFTATKAPTASTNARFISNIVALAPRLYTIFLINRSGQTIAASWTFTAATEQFQYT